MVNDLFDSGGEQEDVEEDLEESSSRSSDDEKEDRLAPDFRAIAAEQRLLQGEKEEENEGGFAVDCSTLVMTESEPAAAEHDKPDWQAILSSMNKLELPPPQPADETEDNPFAVDCGTLVKREQKEVAFFCFNGGFVCARWCSNRTKRRKLQRRQRPTGAPSLPR